MKKTQKESRALLKGTEKARQVAADVKVGKGKPPEAFKWRRGQSGNPSGKPSAHREVIVASVREMLAEINPKLNKSLFERLLEQCARRALQGSKWHMGVLLDYGLGKPTQILEHSGSLDLTRIVREARERAEAAERAEAEAALPALPAATDAHRATHAQDATATIEQGEDAEQPSTELTPALWSSTPKEDFTVLPSMAAFLARLALAHLRLRYLDQRRGGAA